VNEPIARPDPAAASNRPLVSMRGLVRQDVMGESCTRSTVRSIAGAIAFTCVITACGGNTNTGSASQSPVSGGSGTSDGTTLPAPLIDYRFDALATGATTIADRSGNGNTAVIKGTGATVADGTLSLPGGASDSDAAYLEVPAAAFAGLTDVTVSLWLTDTTRAVHHSAAYVGNVDPTKGYWLLNPQSPSGYARSVMTAETGGASTEVGATGSSGWQHRSCMHSYTTVLKGSDRTMAVYVDGTKVADATMPATFKQYGDLVAYIGKSPYGDAFFRGKIAGYSVYGSALGQSAVTKLWREKALDQAVACVSLPSATVEDLALPGSPAGTTASWKVSSGSASVRIEGGIAKVTRPAAGTGSATAVLEATFTDGNSTRTQQYTVKVGEDIGPSSTYGTVARRAETGIDIVGGQYTPGRPGFVAGDWCLMGRDTHVVLEGSGYVRIRWELEFWYGWGQIAMPEINALSDETQVIRVGEGGQFDQKIGYNMTDNSPELGYHDWYIWFSGRISIVNHERIPSTAHWQSPYTASYNLGIGRSWYDQVNANAAIKYDNSTGYLPPSTYKIISRGLGYNDYWDQPLVEARDRAFDSSLPADKAARAAYRALDGDSANQWWTITPNAGGYYTIVNQLNGKALAAEGTAAGRNIVTVDADPAAATQRWRINRASNGPSISDDSHYTFTNVATGLILSDDGTAIGQQAADATGQQQRFLLRHTLGHPASLAEPSLPASGYDRYESESVTKAAYKASAFVLGNAAVSGTRYITLYDADSYVTYSISAPKAGAYRVRIHYGEDAASSQDVYVNDQLVGQVAYAATSAFPAGAHDSVSHKLRLYSGTGAMQELTLNLKAGANSIRFQSKVASGLEHDFVDVSQQPL